MWQVHKAAGRPWPVLDTDDVVDFKVMEAVALKAAQEEEEARKAQERKDWKKDRGDLEKFA